MRAEALVQTPDLFANCASPFLKGWLMTSKKTLPQREKELQSLLATAAGRKALDKLESPYHAAAARLSPLSTSVITYIFVHEREPGLIIN
jgi:hypothetical protein